MDAVLLSCATEPWPSIEVASQSLSFEDDFKPFIRLPDSQTYISVLEAKLGRLKGLNNNQLTSSKLMDELTIFKKDHMAHLMMMSGHCAADEGLADINLDREILQPGFIQMRLYPERQALTAEELQSLVLADYLSKKAGGDDDDDGANLIVTMNCDS